jgi:predicted Rdx family selenoprotein
MKLSSQDLKAKLSQLPAERLAAALVDIRYSSDGVEAAIERLLASPAERVQRFEEKLQHLLSQNSQRYGPADATTSDHLQQILLELHDDDVDPERGFAALLDFFRADEVLIENYDDSYGSVAHLYEHTAAEILVTFASKLDEIKVIPQLGQLLSEDPYEVRITILKQAGRFLSETGLRQLVALFESKSSRPDADSQHMDRMLEELAVQLRDPDLFQSALLRRLPKLRSEDYVRLAQIHLHREEYQMALDSLDRDPEGEAVKGYHGARIRLACLKHLGKRVEHQIAAWEIFTSLPSEDRFEKLVEEVGAERREALKDKVVDWVLANPRFRSQSAGLLLFLERENEAERYVLELRDQLNGDDYYSLAELASGLRRADRSLAAVLCYRALLNRILERKRSKAYHHAADYFQALTDLADHIGEWDDIPPHSVYVRALRAQHGRKYAFWSRIEDA